MQKETIPELIKWLAENGYAAIANRLSRAYNRNCDRYPTPQAAINAYWESSATNFWHWLYAPAENE